MLFWTLLEPYLERNLSILKTKGRLLQVGLMGGTITEINLNTVMRNRLQLIGSVMRTRSIDEKSLSHNALWIVGYPN